MSNYQQLKRSVKNIFLRPKKIGLVLGGGGARGLAHIGVLKVLVDEKIPINYITATSSGALVGALFSGGVSPYDISKIAKASGWMKYIQFQFSSSGPIFGEGIEKLIINSIGNKKIEELRVPMSIIATDLKTGERVVMKKGNLAKAVHASSAVPGLFPPVLFDGRYLSDGMVVDNVPVTSVLEMGADFIIAVDVVPKVILKEWKPNLISVIERALDISCRRLSEESKKFADIVIDPININMSALSMNRVDDLIKMGEAATRAAIPEIKKKLRLK